jgi:hypothetical protein
MDNYTFKEHRHNYAVWTAARVVSRNFTTTKNVKEAIATSGLRAFTSNNIVPSKEEFDKINTRWAESLIESLQISTGK